LPAASPQVRRTLYFYKGSAILLAGFEVKSYHSVELLSEMDIIIEAGNADAFMLLLQGMPIAEPVARYGPFVMNTQAEIQQAFRDYRETQFGGWPWEKYDHVHPRTRGRFAKYADGKEETP